MGATNRSKTARVREVTLGITPSNPAFREMRVTSNGLTFDPERKTSEEIRSDRQITDSILTGLQAGGPIGIEMSFEAHDLEFEEALQGTWTRKAERDNAGVADSVITAATASSDTYTVLDAAIDFVVGHLVLATGFAQALNNALFRAQASTSGTSVIAPSSPGLADETAPAAAAKLKAVGFEGAAADITATATGLASTLLNFTTLGIQVGEWHKIGGDAVGTQFATAANNAWARVSAVAAGAITYDVLPAGWGVDAGTGKTIQVFFGDFLKNGTTQRSVSIERQQQDLTAPSYEVFKGMQIDTASITFSSGEIAKGSFGYVGMTGTIDTVRTSGATDVAPAANAVLNASSNVGRIAENGTIISGPSYLTELGFNLKNNLERQRAIGTIGAVGIRNGEIELTGTLNAYFGDTLLQGKVLNDTETSLMWRVGRADGNRLSYVFDVPRAKLTGTSPVDGKNQDRMFNGSYSALRHAALGYTVSIQQFYYLPVSVAGV